MTLAKEELEAAALAVIPAATSFWVGLFTVMPDENGENGTESTATGYAREEVSEWLTKTVSNEDERAVVRYNAEDHVFDPITEDTFAMGLGVWDASVAGVLKYWIPFSEEVEIPTGSEPNFEAGTLQIGFGDPTNTKLEGFAVLIELEGTTTDATPIVLGTLLSLVDGQATTIVTTITGQATGGKHYWRRFETSFHRDDGGPGSETWTLREMTPEGNATREGFVTASGSMDLDVNEVKIRVLGEAGTTVNWKVDARVRHD